MSGFAQKSLSCEAGVRKAREAGDSIKPGAQAPGSDHKNEPEPVKRVTAFIGT